MPRPTPPISEPTERRTGPAPTGTQASAPGEVQARVREGGARWRTLMFEPTPPDAPRGLRPLLREILTSGTAFLVIAFLVKTFLFQAFYIPSASMEPTLHGCTGCTGDRVIAERLTGRFGSIDRGDIVVFADTQHWLPAYETHPASFVRKAVAFVGLTADSSHGYLVKRVIGVSGDTVEGRNGTVYVNGHALTETYLAPGTHPTDVTFTVTVPTGKLWVMGDNRAKSADSRYHRDEPGGGFVPESDVVGRAVAIAWPLPRVSSLTSSSTFDAVEPR